MTHITSHCKLTVKQHLCLYGLLEAFVLVEDDCFGFSLVPLVPKDGDVIYLSYLLKSFTYFTDIILYSVPLGLSVEHMKYKWMIILKVIMWVQLEIGAS